MRVRAERGGDADPVRLLYEGAFETALEADLVEALRATARPFIALVVEEGDGVIGHIAFSPVTVHARDDSPSSDGRGRRGRVGAAAAGQSGLIGLGPMAVAEPWRGRGAGGLLVREGLARCRASGFAGAVVLGHPTYYPRFGFRPASDFGLACEYLVPDDVFMARALVDGGLDGIAGTVRYGPAFPPP